MDTIKDFFLHSCGTIIYAIKPIIFKEIHIKNKFALVIINTYIFYILCKLTYDIRNDFIQDIIQEINENINESVDESVEKFYNNFNYINEQELYYLHEDNPWNNTDIY